MPLEGERQAPSRHSKGLGCFMSKPPPGPSSTLTAAITDMLSFREELMPETGFAKMSLLGFSVNKGPEPLAAYVTRSHTHTPFFGNVLDRSDPSVEIAG